MISFNVLVRNKNFFAYRIAFWIVIDENMRYWNVYDYFVIKRFVNNFLCEHNLFNNCVEMMLDGIYIMVNGIR